MDSSQSKLAWIDKGLRFECTGCGACCTGAPGYVWVTLEEIEAISNYLELSIEEFSTRCIRKVGSRYSLIERPQSNDCVFLEGKGCSIYPVRPEQCKTFPWWVENLESEQAWKRAAKECEGINCDAPLVPLEEIRGHVQDPGCG